MALVFFLASSYSCFELLDNLLRKVREVEFPFGGIQLILFGDFLQ